MPMFGTSVEDILKRMRAKPGQPAASPVPAQNIAPTQAGPQSGAIRSPSSPLPGTATMQQPAPQNTATAQAGNPWDTSTLSTAGRYGEGQVQDILSRLEAQKSQLLAGNINATDFLSNEKPLIDLAAKDIHRISGQGSNAANLVNPLYLKLQQEGFLKGDAGGQYTAGLGLTDAEYANLPASAKPTADQLQQNPGLVAALPGQTGQDTMIAGQQQQQTQLADQARQQTLLDQQNTQKQLQDLYSEFLGQTKTNYDQQYQDIAKNLGQQQEQNLQGLTTGPAGAAMRNYYNSLGILDSGAFNSALATGAQGIEQNTQNQLLQAQLAEQQALQSAAQQGTNALGSFGVGAEQQLQDISNQNYGTQSGLGTAGLQRTFGLQDYYQQLQDQKQMADMQNNQYLSMIGGQQQNPWLQAGMSVLGGLAGGAGKAIGAKF